MPDLNVGIVNVLGPRLVFLGHVLSCSEATFYLTRALVISDLAEIKANDK